MTEAKKKNKKTVTKKLEARHVCGRRRKVPIRKIVGFVPAKTKNPYLFSSFSAIKIAGAVVVLLMISLGVNGVGTTNAYFNDVENSSGNTVQAGLLSVELSSLDDFLPAVTPSQVSRREIKISNTGNLEFQYDFKIENISGDTTLCDNLNLIAKLGATEIYNGNFNSFVVSTSTLANLANADLTMEVTLPDSADTELENKTCSFDLRINAWQTDFSDNLQGFSDTEIIKNTISSGVWTENVPPPPFVPGPGDVVINEIMWMGSSASHMDEWLELRNMTVHDIDISNWRIYGAVSGSGGHLEIPQGYTIPANGYFLVTNYNKEDSAINVTSNLVKTSINFNNEYHDNGVVILKDKNINIIDSIPAPATETSDPWPKGENGTIKKSMERNIIPGDGTLPGSWHTCEPTIMSVSDLAAMKSYWDSDRQNNNCGTPGSPNLSQNDPTAADFISASLTGENVISVDEVGSPDVITEEIVSTDKELIIDGTVTNKPEPALPISETENMPEITSPTGLEEAPGVETIITPETTYPIILPEPVTVEIVVPAEAEPVPPAEAPTVPEVPVSIEPAI